MNTKALKRNSRHFLRYRERAVGASPCARNDRTHLGAACENSTKHRRASPVIEIGVGKLTPKARIASEFRWYHGHLHKIVRPKLQNVGSLGVFCFCETLYYNAPMIGFFVAVGGNMCSSAYKHRLTLTEDGIFPYIAILNGSITQQIYTSTKKIILHTKLEELL